MMSRVQHSPTMSRARAREYGLLGNAVFSLLTGVILVAASGSVATFLGIPDSRVLVGIGIGLLPFAGHLLLALRRKFVRVGEIYYLSAMDGVWVLGSVVIWLFGLVPFTAAGMVVFGLVALTVGDFMVMQVVGVRWLQAAA